MSDTQNMRKPAARDFMTQALGYQCSLSGLSGLSEENTEVWERKVNVLKCNFKETQNGKHCWYVLAEADRKCIWGVSQMKLS